MTGRDRLRKLLDAVLDDAPGQVGAMASRAYASPHHFSRQLSRGIGESPAALRRRVLMERAAWQIAEGSSVTDAARLAGYDSLEGFSRAFSRAHGHPPSSAPPRSPRNPVTRHWIDAPNGIHFHPPINLWWSDPASQAPPVHPVAAHLLQHDVADTTHLIQVCQELDEQEYRRIRLTGLIVLPWDGPEESIAAVLTRLVSTKQVWLASVEGLDQPPPAGDSAAELADRFQDVGVRWLDAVADIARRDAWQDRFIDALCDPPESFVLAHLVSHVLTYSAHRRQLVRHLIRSAGVEVDHGDPITWFRSIGETP